MLILGYQYYFCFAIVHCIIAGGTPCQKGDTDAKKKRPRGFIYVDRAQTEQQLNLVHDRGIYFTSKLSSKIKLTLDSDGTSALFCSFPKNNIAKNVVASFGKPKT